MCNDASIEALLSDPISTASKFWYLWHISGPLPISDQKRSLNKFYNIIHSLLDIHLSCISVVLLVGACPRPTEFTRPRFPHPPPLGVR
jgi:hypothetical protein